MQERKGFPFWGAIALPAGMLWGTLLGIGIGYLSGNAFIGGRNRCGSRHRDRPEPSGRRGRDCL